MVTTHCVPLKVALKFFPGIKSPAAKAAPVKFENKALAPNASTFRVGDAAFVALTLKKITLPVVNPPIVGVLVKV